jgi:hypothetical protein
VHPLPQGRQGHEGHLSTAHAGGGVGPLPHGQRWEAATPHQAQPRYYFFFFLAFFFIERLTSFRVQAVCRPHRIYFFFFFVAFFLATRSPPSAIVQ